MAVITKYTCDRCDATQETDEQMWSVGVSINYYRKGVGSTICGQMWCRKCVDMFELLGRIPKPAASASDPAPPEITLEDKIREIVRQEIDAP